MPRPAESKTGFSAGQTDYCLGFLCVQISLQIPEEEQNSEYCLLVAPFDGIRNTKLQFIICNLYTREYIGYRVAFAVLHR